MQDFLHQQYVFSNFSIVEKYNLLKKSILSKALVAECIYPNKNLWHFFAFVHSFLRQAYAVLLIIPLYSFVDHNFPYRAIIMILIMYDFFSTFEPQPNRMTESLSHKKRSAILIPRRIIQKKTSKNESQTPTKWAPTSHKWSHNPL